MREEKFLKIIENSLGAIKSRRLRHRRIWFGNGEVFPELDFFIRGVIWVYMR